MRLDKNYRLENDSNNWTLIFEEDRKKEDGTKYLFQDTIGYYPKMKMALSKYLDSCLKECSTGQEIFDEIARVEKVIIKING